MEESIKEQTYEETKTEFEKHVCRIDDVLLYPVLDTKKERTLYTLLQLKERFSHLKYLEGKTEHKFVPEWADDPNKKTFRKMEVVPKNCPPDVYNIWEGFDIERKKNTSKETGDIQPFLDLLWDMSGGDETVQKYLLKWIAFLFQNPEKKPKTALVFQSAEGSGKNEFWGFIGKLMGKATYLETSNAERDIFEKHSLALQGRKLVFINEMNKNIHKSYEDRMKGLITDTSLYLRPLHKQAYEVDNLAGFVLAGNNRLLVLVKQNERRFVLVEVRGEYLPNKPEHKSFWSNWFRWKEDAENQIAVYEYLMNIETNEKYLITERPKTRYYREMIQKCLPPEIKWLEHLMCEEFPEEFCPGNRNQPLMHPREETKLSSSTLIAKYASYIRGWRISEPTDAQFGNKLKDMIERDGLPFTKGRNEVGRVAWTFSRRTVYDWLKEKEYTEYLLGNEDDEYGGMTPPVGTEGMRREFDIWRD